MKIFLILFMLATVAIADKTCIRIDESITICTDDITGEEEVILTSN